MTAELLDRIFHFLKTQRLGPSRAIPRDKLMALFGIDSKNPTIDRAFREWYSTAGIPSCEHGLYAPRNEADVEACRLYLWPKTSPDRIRDRIERVYRAFPSCRPERGEQLELRLGI
jgi:hypothetical protein